MSANELPVVAWSAEIDGNPNFGRGWAFSPVQSDKTPLPLADHAAAQARIEALEAKVADRIETIVNIAKFLGMDPDEEAARPDYDPKGPASLTIIRAIERYVAMKGGR